MAAKSTQRPSTPGPGNSLASATEKRAVHIRAAASTIESALINCDIAQEYSDLYGTRWQLSAPPSAHTDISHLAGWTLVTIWMLGRLNGFLPDGYGISDAEEWFWGRAGAGIPKLARHLPPTVHSQVDKILDSVVLDNDLRDLLPYILDPIGPASRLDVISDPSIAGARKKRQQSGIYYTPSDVAEYIAEHLVQNHRLTSTKTTLLDPACGSGVFLRAALQALQVRTSGGKNLFTIALESLHGIDINLQAVEAATFLLLNDTIKDATKLDLDPWAAWHLLRMNFAHADAVAFEEPTADAGNCEEVWALQRAGLLENRLPDIRALPEIPAQMQSLGFFDFQDRTWPLLNHAFPAVNSGFDILLGNPPYAEIGERVDWDILNSQYRSTSTPAKASDDLYPLFVEMGWRYTRRPGGYVGMVIPLSIAYQTRQQFQNCRDAIQATGGEWQFAFYDREPHALFGEEVKTRNAIVFGSVLHNNISGGASSRINVTGLTRWTSRTRATLFDTTRFHSLGNLNIRKAIPKVSHPVFAESLKSLNGKQASFRNDWASVSTCEPKVAFGVFNSSTVFVASTAYNFLNVLRPHTLDSVIAEPLSTNKLFAIQFRNAEDADASFALLSSRLVYWWWHVFGDGFHVTRSLLETIPISIGELSRADYTKLSHLGRTIWDIIQTDKVVSLNKGKATIAYRPFQAIAERDEVDSILARHAGLNEALPEELRSFMRETLLIDPTDSRRNEVHGHVVKEGHAI